MGRVVGLFLRYTPLRCDSEKVTVSSQEKATPIVDQPENSPDGSEQAEQAPGSAGKSSRCSRTVARVPQVS